MKLKEQAMSLLAEVPADSLVWRRIFNEARMAHGIAVAEMDVSAGRLHSHEEVRAQFEIKWATRRGMLI